MSGDLDLLLRGVLLGLAVAAPVGPIGVLCIGAADVTAEEFTRQG